jgi:hypothetical protein
LYISGFSLGPVTNVLFDSVWEFLSVPSLVSVAVVYPAAISASRTWSFFLGARLIAQNVVAFGRVLTVEGVLSESPMWPRDFYIRDEPGLAGERLVLSVSAAVNYRWAVFITEVT